jgi:hypothetical protein
LASKLRDPIIVMGSFIQSTSRLAARRCLRRPIVLLFFVGAVLLLSACAETRVARFGALGNDEALVTLVVTEDLDRVQRECQNVPEHGTILGCHMSRPIVLSEDVPVVTMTIVRYTDALPSAMAFEIDAHELCHAVAAVQLIGDPCHNGNDGVVQAGLSSRGSAIHWGKAR